MYAVARLIVSKAKNSGILIGKDWSGNKMQLLYVKVCIMAQIKSSYYMFALV